MKAVELERRDLLRDRLRSWKGTLIPEADADLALNALPSEGRRFRFFFRTVIGLLAAISGGLLFLFFLVIEMPQKELLAAGICIAGSEWVRHSLHWRHTGAEEGWMFAGAWLLVFALPDTTWDSDMLWIFLAGATCLAAARVRAPLLNGVGALLLIAGISSMWGTGGAIHVALAGAVAAALLRTKGNDSPYVEISLVWAEIAFSLAAALHGLEDPPLIAFSIAIALLVGIGLNSRETIGLWAALPLIAVTAHEIGRLLPLPREWKLTLGGLMLIAVASLIERWLRDGPHGWTSRRLEGDDSDLLEIAGAVAVATPSVTTDQEQNGGEFGGGGATERY